MLLFHLFSPFEGSAFQPFECSRTLCSNFDFDCSWNPCLLGGLLRPDHKCILDLIRAQKTRLVAANVGRSLFFFWALAVPRNSWIPLAKPLSSAEPRLKNTVVRGSIGYQISVPPDLFTYWTTSTVRHCLRLLQLSSFLFWLPQPRWPQAGSIIMHFGPS